MGICLTIINLQYTRAGVCGIVSILLGLYLWGNTDTNGMNEAEKFNFRETDSEDNCLKCKYM